MIQKTFFFKKGFSMLEVIIAGFVLVIGLLGASNLIAGSMRQSINTRDKIVAIELAQEGVELARNLWDNEKLNVAVDAGERTCRFDFDDVNAASACAGVGAQWDANQYALMFNDSNNFYNSFQNGATATKFKRKTIVKGYPNNGGADRQVASFVTWGAEDITLVNSGSCKASQKCVFTEAVLTSWR